MEQYSVQDVNEKTTKRSKERRYTIGAIGGRPVIILPPKAKIL